MFQLPRSERRLGPVFFVNSAEKSCKDIFMYRITPVLYAILIILISSFHIACEQQVKPYRSARGQSITASCTVNQRTIDAAIQAYRMSHNGALPTSLDEIIESGQLRAYPHCPEDGIPYDYDPVTGTVSCPNHPRE